MKSYTIPEINYEMVCLEPGEFLMGQPLLGSGRIDFDCFGYEWRRRHSWESINIEKQHKVKLCRGFFIGVTVVTQKQWNVVMNSKPWVEGQKEYMVHEYRKDIEGIGWDNWRKLEDELIPKFLNSLKFDNEILKKAKDHFKWFTQWLYYTDTNIHKKKFGNIDIGSKNRYQSIGDLQSYDISPFKYWLQANTKVEPYDTIRMLLSDKEVEETFVTIKNFKKWLKKNNIEYPENRKPVVYKPREYIKDENDYPATNITWKDCVKFIEKLNDVREDKLFRLPTEAEWEYACRSGSKSRFCFGNNEDKLVDYASYGESFYGDGIEEKGPKKVALKLPNNWGLFDVHGNVWEYCSDFFSPYDGDVYDSIIDPQGPPSAIEVLDTGDSDDISYRRYNLGHVIRGGAWSSSSSNCRCASRDFENEHLRIYESDDCGFRIVMQCIP
jgi:formylglycine-generating enzyme required for sulfatase activity